MARTKPVSQKPKEDLAGWRRDQFVKLGIKGDLGRFLAGTKVDTGHVRKMIEKGARPLDAVRIEAGRDHLGDDPTFDHAAFDKLLAETVPF